MVDRIGSGGLQREALLAALRQKAASTGEVQRASEDLQRAAGAAPEGGASKPDFAGALKDGLKAVDAEVRAADALPQDVAMGRIEDFHEVAARLKRADLSFKFAMEIRNKLIDAYREVMRMPV